MNKMKNTTLLLLAALSLAPGCFAAEDAAPPVAADAIVSMQADKFEIPGSFGIRMVRIEKGKAVLGSPADEPGRKADEAQRSVVISRPFYMAETEVTQGQYMPVILPDFKPLLATPSWAQSGLPQVDQGGPFHNAGRNIADPAKHPMEGVVWKKAVEFCAKLTERERQAGRLPAGYEYRLPTEAEWEYACRAGTTGRFNAEGPLNGFSVAGPDLENTRPVKGDRKPNAWGLYDLHGNVYEWCLDWYGARAAGEATDPTGPAAGELKVARGGCYLSGRLDGAKPDPARDESGLRSAARGKFLPDLPLGILGFRPVLAPAVQK